MSKKIWLVTGGAGFIGSNIAEELVRRGEKVRILDNFSTGKKEHIKNFIGRVELLKGDIRNLADLKKALKGAALVLHQAALRSVPKSINNPFETNQVNVEGTLNLLIAAKNAGVKRVVYASSSSVYGDSKRFPQREDMKPTPISPYAVSKLAAENYCVMFARTYGLETVSLRYFNVFGPRQDPESMYSAVIPRFMDLLKQRKSLEIHWDGKQARDFTYVSNVVDANIKAALAKNISGEVYNIAGGSAVSLLEMVSILKKISGVRIKKNFKPKRAGDVRKTRADVSKARKDFEYEPRVSFEKGLLKTWEYFTGLEDL